MKTSGIYMIECNGRKYVGQSLDIEARWRGHITSLLNGDHVNIHLQEDFNKYGHEGFSFRVLEYCSADDLSEREEYYIKTLNSKISEGGYNIKGSSNASWMGIEERRLIRNMNPYRGIKNKVKRAIVSSILSTLNPS
jgi:group I intron endonuclease